MKDFGSYIYANATIALVLWALNRIPMNLLVWPYRENRPMRSLLQLTSFQFIQP